MKKASASALAFSICAERQGFEPWRQFPVDRLAICSITTLAPLLRSSRASLWKLTGDKNSEISSLSHQQARDFVSWHSRPTTRPFVIDKNTLMKKFLFLGAFAIFALTASAQSTEAPADKKAKTEQTCSKDAKKASCEKTCDKSKSASCCSKGASASTDAKGATGDKSKTAGCCSKGASASANTKGATCSKSQTAGCCSAASASASTDAKKKGKKKKKGNKVASLSGSN